MGAISIEEHVASSSLILDFRIYLQLFNGKSKILGIEHFYLTKDNTVV